MDIDARQISDFQRDGHLVLHGLFSGSAIAEIIRWTDEVQSWPETPGKAMKYFETSKRDGSRILQRIENFYPYHGGFRTLCDGPEMRDVSASLLGSEAILFKEKINFKLSGGEGFAPHQDAQADWGRYCTYHITVMVSVDPCTLQNGCLEMVSGHHDRGLIGDMWTPLAEDQMQGMNFVPIITQPGDAVFFDSYAPHRSEPNQTDTHRRVLYITYNRLLEGDWRIQYYADKRRSFPPDCEREPGKVYQYRV